MTQKIERAFDFTITDSEEREDGDGLTLEGYAAVFNSPTEINSWEGQFTETIAPGAFRQTIGDKMPILQFNHGRGYMGELPIGRIKSLKEDERGLRVRARLSNNWLIEPVRDAIRDGAITGMSFRFSVWDEEWSADETRRTIKAVDLHELGPVVFPAYHNTTVGVRSSDDPISQLVALIRADDSLRSSLAAVLAFGGNEVLAEEGGAPELADGKEAREEPIADESTDDSDDDWRSDALALADLIDREVRLTERRRLL